MSDIGQAKNMTTPEQLRAARALLGLSQDDIANKIGSSSKTVRRAESGPKQVSESTVTAIRTVLEAEGVEFIPENGGGAGVRLSKKQND